MKLAADFRAIARNALKGKWPVAVLTGFLASLMGALIFSNGGGSSGNSGDSNSVNISPADVRQWITLIYIALVVLVIWVLVCLVISGAGKFGYAIFNLKLVDGEAVKVSDLFSQFHRLGDGFLMNLLMGIYTFLWSLLFVIPGIVKALSYAMTPYILYEHPEYTVNEAITRSRELMDGNKFALFCLNFSFIGWSLLIGLSGAAALWGVLLGQFWTFAFVAVCVIAELFLGAYMEAAQAAFYRHISYVPTAYDTTSEPNEMGGAF